MRFARALATPSGTALLVLVNFHRFVNSAEIVQALAHQILQEEMQALDALLEAVRLAEPEGFIRRFNFTDGPHYTLIALWRTVDDAHAFFSSAEHQAAMTELYRQRWQYSHFAGLWQTTTPRERVIFCQLCDGVTPATAGRCVGCGTELFDPYAVPSHVDH